MSLCTCMYVCVRVYVCLFCVCILMDDLYVMVGTDGGGWLHGEQVQAG